MYCKIFVYGPSSVEDLVHILQTGTGAVVERRSLELPDGTDVDVRVNEESDPGKAAQGGGDFLCFPYYLDVEDHEPEGEPDGGTPLVATARRLLTLLSSAGFRYVVAADFEEFLPARGDNRASDQ